MFAQVSCPTQNSSQLGVMRCTYRNA